MKVDLQLWTDYDIHNWVWTCPRCENRVRQDYFDTKDVLTCCMCLTEMTMHSKTGYVGEDKRSTHVAEVTLKQPTRLELLEGRDSHVDYLRAQMEEKRAALLLAIDQNEVTTEYARGLLDLCQKYDKHLIAYTRYLATVGE